MRRPVLDLTINPHAPRPIGVPRTVRLAEPPVDRSSPAARTADRLVDAVRENVRFLNRHLAVHGGCLELPRMIDNVLYLAYTVTVNEGAAIETAELRRWLADAGIETRSAFSFTARPENIRDRTAVQRTADDSDGAPPAGNSFCLACHQYLSILDLRHIIDAFASFFAQRDISQPDPSPGDGCSTS